MKHKKQFFSILLSVIICVFVFGAIVYATTTIGNNITVGGMLTISDVNQNDQIGITSSISADTDGDTVYGLYQEVDVGIGAPSTATRTAYGIYQALSNSSEYDAGWSYNPFIAGITQSLDGSTNAATTKDIYGFWQDMPGYTGDNTDIYGFYSALQSGGANSVVINYDGSVSANSTDGIAQTGIVLSASMSRAGAGDTVYGIRITDGIITGGTGYGINIDVDDTDWTTAYSIYVNDGSFPSYFGNASASFGGDVKIGNGTAGHLDSDTENLYVEGILEVDGTAHFDGLVSASDANGMMVGGGAKFFGGTASPDFNCTGGSLYIRSGTGNEDTSFYLCNPTNTWNAINFTTF